MAASDWRKLLPTAGIGRALNALLLRQGLTSGRCLAARRAGGIAHPDVLGEPFVFALADRAEHASAYLAGSRYDSTSRAACTPTSAFALVNPDAARLTLSRRV